MKPFLINKTLFQCQKKFLEKTMFLHSMMLKKKQLKEENEKLKNENEKLRKENEKLGNENENKNGNE